MNKKDYWINRRYMAWSSVAGLMFMLTPWAANLSDAVGGALVLAFAGIVANYTIQATRDDMSARGANESD